MTDHVTDDDLVLHYYGELPAAEDARVETHLGLCRDCQANHGRLQRVMAFVDSAPAVEPPNGFERIAWAKLAPALDAPRRGWVSSMFSPGRLAVAASVAMLIGAAFIAGRMLPRTARPPQAAAQSPEKVRERILLVDLGEHLDRSQRVLVELVSATNEHGPVDISMERDRAEQLVVSNRLYRQTAASTGDAAMAAILDELERVLVDVAASPSTVSQEDLASVRRRIDSKELLFKMRVVSSQVRERQKAGVQQRTNSSALGS